MSGSLNSLFEILKFFNTCIESIENEEEQKHKKEEIQKIMNIQNEQGNTVLHESVLNESQTMTEKLFKIGWIDETIVNKNNKTAKDI